MNILLKTVVICNWANYNKLGTMVLKLSETVTNPGKTESYAEPESSICKLREGVQ